MFRNVTVSDYRTFEKARLDDLGQTTAFIGRNAAGKSNLLHALDDLGRLATVLRASRYAAFASDRSVTPPEFAADIALDEGLYTYRLILDRVMTQTPAGPRPTHYLTRTERLDWTDPKAPASKTRLFSRVKDRIKLSVGPPDIRTDDDTPALLAVSSLLPADSPVRKLTDPLLRFLSRIRYYPLDEPARPDMHFRFLVGRDYNQWLGEYQRTGVLGNDVAAQILHLALTSEDRYSELLDWLGRNGLRLVEDLTVRVLTRGGFEPLTPDPGGGPLDDDAGYAVEFHAGGEGPRSLRSFDDLSQGTRRLVRLVTAMAFGDNSVMLVEHPEDGIHSGLLRKVMGLFVTGFCPSQVFLSTHSDIVLNELESDAIRFVAAKDGKSSVRKMTPAERAAASRYIDSDIEGTLAEFAHSIED